MDGDRSPTRRVYLDNAATTWPKPEAVYVAVERYQRECGVAAGRGAYRDALETLRTVTAARLGVARLLGAAAHRLLICTHNATDALKSGPNGWRRARQGLEAEPGAVLDVHALEAAQRDRHVPLSHQREQFLLTLDGRIDAADGGHSEAAWDGVDARLPNSRPALRSARRKVSAAIARAGPGSSIAR